MGSLILVRHSTTAASAAGRNLGRSDDPPLATEGANLAARLAQTLSTELAELPSLPAFLGYLRHSAAGRRPRRSRPRWGSRSMRSRSTTG